MEWTFVFLEVGGRKAVADYHVGALLEDWFNHCCCGANWVGVVAINHDVTFGVDFAKHAADDVAFALFVFATDDGASFLGDFGCIVGGVIIVDINCSFGESFFEVGDNFFNGFGFVVAWDEDGYFIFFHVVSFD